MSILGLNQREKPMVVIFFLLYFGILFSPSPLLAQAHLSYGKFNVSEKDEAQILFAKGRYKESIEKFKEVLKSEGETSNTFRMRKVLLVSPSDFSTSLNFSIDSL